MEYEGCSNMNASSFITFSHMCYDKMVFVSIKEGLYVTFKLAPDINKNTVHISCYSPLNEGHLNIRTNSMLRTYTSDIDERIILL